MFTTYELQALLIFPQNGLKILVRTWIRNLNIPKNGINNIIRTAPNAYISKAETGVYSMFSECAPKNIKIETKSECRFRICIEFRASETYSFTFFARELFIFWVGIHIWAGWYRPIDTRQNKLVLKNFELNANTILCRRNTHTIIVIIIIMEMQKMRIVRNWVRLAKEGSQCQWWRTQQHTLNYYIKCFV